MRQQIFFNRSYVQVKISWAAIDGTFVSLFINPFMYKTTCRTTKNRTVSAEATVGAKSHQLLSSFHVAKTRAQKAGLFPNRREEKVIGNEPRLVSTLWTVEFFLDLFLLNLTVASTFKHFWKVQSVVRSRCYKTNQYCCEQPFTSANKLAALAWQNMEMLRLQRNSRQLSSRQCALRVE